MGFVPFFVVTGGVLFLVIALQYHTFRNYRTLILQQIAGIQEIKKQVRTDVDGLETLSVPELESFCENMCGYLSGQMDSETLEQKLNSINRAFGLLYSDSESKHIQEELLGSINKNVSRISRMNKDLQETRRAYEKLLVEKPYSMVAKLFHFEPVQLPWESRLSNQAA